MPKAKVVSQDTLAVANNVYEFCKAEAAAGEPLVPLQYPLKRASEMTKLSKSTLCRASTAHAAPSAEQTKPPRKTHKNKIIIDDFDKCVIRRTINEMYTQKKVFPTMSLIHEELVEKINFPGSKSCLRNVIKELGFVWKKCETNRKLLMERADVVAQRVRYLRAISQFRKAGREIVYMDETYIHSSHGVSKGWQSADGEIGHHVPFNKGERFIIVHAGSKQGFVPNALYINKAVRASGDYHLEMNSEVFEQWLRDQLIPNLPRKSVIIMDNASYHSIQIDKCPVQSTKKADIQGWLARHSIAFDRTMLKAELLHLCKVNKPSPTFRCDNLLRDHGHDVLRLPPYHADLNAIELIWGIVKNDIAKKNARCTMSSVKELALKKFGEVGPTEWEHCIRHVEGVEQQYWKLDIAVEEEVEKVVINLGSDDSDDNSSENESEEADSDDTLPYDVPNLDIAE